MYDLTIIRHGKTTWTEEKRFAGWGNSPLSDKGRSEAISAGKTLKRAGASFDICFTSCLKRANNTAQIILEQLNLPLDICLHDWRLNERHYGALQGELRKDMIIKHGADNVKKWRHNYTAQPPELTDDDPRWHEQLERLSVIQKAKQPRSESMQQAVKRTQNYWNAEIIPALKSKKKVLVIAHTNTLRSVVRDIEDLNDNQAAGFRIPTATPRHYDLDVSLKPLRTRDLTDDPKAKLYQWINRKKVQFL